MAPNRGPDPRQMVLFTNATNQPKYMAGMRCNQGYTTKSLAQRELRPFITLVDDTSSPGCECLLIFRQELNNTAIGSWILGTTS